MSSSLRIGPFLVHPDLNEITREGQPVKIEPQVMKLLVFMSGHPRELLTRQQILHEVWDGTSVSDDALNRAIRVLRKALGDDANEPQFIETLPRRGYRLIAPVSRVDEVETTSSKLSRWLRYTAALFVAAGALAGWYFLARDNPVPPRNALPTVAVLHFDNLAADPATEWLRVGLADMLITDLAQSPHLEVINPSRLFAIFGDGETEGQGNEPSEPIQELAARSGIDILIQGSFATAGDAVRINTRIVDSATGRILAAEKVEGTLDAAILALIDELNDRIQSSLAIPLEADEDMDRGLVEISTSSFEAYQHYAYGLHGEVTGDFQAAREQYLQALVADSEFAMAHIRLGAVYRRAGNRGEMRKCFSRAFDLRRRLSTRERLYVEGVHHLFQNSRESYGRAIDRFKEAVELYPDHSLARTALAFRYVFLERYDQAIEQYETLRQRGSLDPDVYEDLAECYAARGDFERGRSLLQDLLRRDPDNFLVNLFLGYYLPVDGRYAEALEALGRAEALRPIFKADAGRLVVYVLQGELPEAEKLAERRIRSARPIARRDGLFNQALIQLHRGSSEEALEHYEELAMPVRSAHVLLETGRVEQALEYAQRARRNGKRWTDRLHGLFLEARAQQDLGFADEADRLSEELEKSAEWPYTDWDRRLHHRLLGEMALARGNTGLAVEELKTAHSLLPPRGTHNIGLDPPQHVLIWYALGRAHWEAGQPEEAAQWFERVVNCAIERYWWPIPYVRSFYFLGRIHESRGHHEKARASYERFVDFWRDGTMDRDQVEDALSLSTGSPASR